MATWAIDKHASGDGADGAVELATFLGEWQDSMGNKVEVEWAKAGRNSRGELDVWLSKGRKPAIQLSVRSRGGGRFQCGHFDLDTKKSNSQRIVWVDAKSPSKTSTWERPGTNRDATRDKTDERWNRSDWKNRDDKWSDWKQDDGNKKWSSDDKDSNRNGWHSNQHWANNQNKSDPKWNTGSDNPNQIPLGHANGQKASEEEAGRYHDVVPSKARPPMMLPPSSAPPMMVPPQDLPPPLSGAAFPPPALPPPGVAGRPAFFPPPPGPPPTMVPPPAMVPQELPPPPGPPLGAPQMLPGLHYPGLYHASMQPPMAPPPSQGFPQASTGQDNSEYRSGLAVEISSSSSLPWNSTSEDRPKDPRFRNDGKQSASGGEFHGSERPTFDDIPTGNIVCDGGNLIFDGGNLICDGGNLIFDGGNLICDGGSIVSGATLDDDILNGTIVCDGGDMWVEPISQQNIANPDDSGHLVDSNADNREQAPTCDSGAFEHRQVERTSTTSQCVEPQETHHAPVLDDNADRHRGRRHDSRSKESDRKRRRRRDSSSSNESKRKRRREGSSRDRGRRR